jgi:hypothetical protein
MTWTRDWRLRWTETWRRLASGRRDPEPDTREDWTSRLVDEGVPTELADEIAAQLAPAHRRLGRGSAAALIQGASLSAGVHALERASVERSLRDVREVERLLGAFSGELEKLDEVLEVLSAYAQRMRGKPIKTPDRTLH